MTSPHRPHDPAAGATAGPPTTPERCPLCGQPNRCAMEIERETGHPQPPCWCTTERFDEALLARLPTAARGKACICQACARSGG